MPRQYGTLAFRWCDYCCFVSTNPSSSVGGDGQSHGSTRAALFVQEICLSKVLVEGDCLRVVSMLNTSVCCNTLYGNAIEETHRQASHFQTCKFIHVRRGGNKLAHALARRAVSSVDFDVWVKEVPSDLESVFQNDVS